MSISTIWQFNKISLSTLFVLTSYVSLTNFFNTQSYILASLPLVLLSVYILKGVLKYSLISSYSITTLIILFLYLGLTSVFYIIDADRYLLVVGYKLVLALLFTFALYGLAIKYRYLGRVNSIDIKTAFGFLVLNILNFVAYVLHNWFNLSPFFEISHGQLQERISYHFIISAPGELDRFTSFFGEPSTFSFIGLFASIVLLRYRKRFLSLINMLLLCICFSASLVFVIPIYIFCLAYSLYGLQKSLIIVVPFLSLIIIYFSSGDMVSNYIFNLYGSEVLGFDKLASRFLTQDGFLGLSRLSFISNAQYSLMPSIIPPSQVVDYLNEAFFMAARYGIILTFIPMALLLRLSFLICLKTSDYLVITNVFSAILFTFVRDFSLINPLVCLLVVPSLFDKRRSTIAF